MLGEGDGLGADTAPDPDQFGAWRLVNGAWRTVLAATVFLRTHTSSTNKELTHVARQQKVDTVFTDDLTGDVLTEDEVQTVTFAVDGTTHEIDLRKDAASLRNDVAAWVEHARTVARPKTTSRSTRHTTTGAQPRNADRDR